jgi:protein SCO1
MRTRLACAAVFCAALFSAGSLTRGFTVFTSEEARKLAVQSAPQTLPSIRLLDAAGQTLDLRDVTKGGRKLVLLDFFFTRCESVCLALGSQFQRLQSEIVQRGLQDRIALLSISFDAAHDTPAALTAYAQRMHADPAIWHFVAPASSADLAAALRGFDVVVIPDKLANFQHNAAIHVLDYSGKLACIIDYEAADTALDAALSLRAAPLAKAP